MTALNYLPAIVAALLLFMLLAQFSTGMAVAVGALLFLYTKTDSRSPLSWRLGMTSLVVAGLTLALQFPSDDPAVSGPLCVVMGLTAWALFRYDEVLAFLMRQQQG